jgi:hypothetical protein
MNPTCQAVPPPFPGSGAVSVRLQIVLGTCACAGATAFLFAVDPNRHAIYPQCFLYKATGFYCAGCGATRALYALVHGRVLEAMHDNALLMTALPVALVVGGAYLWKSWRANTWAPSHLEPRAVTRIGLWIFLTMMLFMVVRNLPGAAFDCLRPLAG